MLEDDVKLFVPSLINDDLEGPEDLHSPNIGICWTHKKSNTKLLEAGHLWHEELFPFVSPGLVVH